MLDLPFRLSQYGPSRRSCMKKVSRGRKHLDCAPGAPGVLVPQRVYGDGSPSAMPPVRFSGHPFVVNAASGVLPNAADYDTRPDTSPGRQRFTLRINVRDLQ